MSLRAGSGNGVLWNTGRGPSPVPRPLVKARGAVHPLPSERENRSRVGARTALEFVFLLPWGESG